MPLPKGTLLMIYCFSLGGGVVWRGGGVVRGVLSREVCPGWFCPGGFCPRLFCSGGFITSCKTVLGGFGRGVLSGGRGGCLGWFCLRMVIHSAFEYNHKYINDHGS